MKTATENKSKRINLRVKSRAKRILERAAGLKGKTVSHFILSSALEQAQKTVRAHEQMSLSEEETTTFFEALEGPVRFNRNLTEALAEHDRRVVSK